MRKIFGGRSGTPEEEEIWRKKEFGGERNLTERRNPEGGRIPEAGRLIGKRRKIQMKH
ncbi:MAG: hypothetical protein ILO53_02330 [Clostridia bacterium]|nr:hypothetical protein [Clostridia bacterium]